MVMVALSWMACAPPSTPPLPSPPPPMSEPAVPPSVAVAMPEHFSGEIAQTHLAALSAQTPRTPGSHADGAARAYLAEAFRAAGARVEIFEEGRRRHLVADLPGESPDILLLVAAYPSLGRDNWIGDSGAALLLELARVWPREDPRYTLRLALAETRAIERGTDDSGATGSSAHAIETGADAHGEGGEDGPGEARLRVVAAGQSLARTLDGAGELERVRCIIVFDGTSRSGLRIARDLRSHPIYREAFWASGRALGFESIFPPGADWTSPRSLHLGFADRTTDGVVAIVDEARARPEVEPIRSVGAGSADSLEAVGLVTIETLRRIMHRLSRIDDFDSRGLRVESSQGRPEEALPKPPETPPSS